ncbi:hypothetical protein [Mesorhizobium sp. M0088]|uniref:hypothetical protein n=1 Tax=Mesorhizobium sp. M0088 TaxID=2956873 RepID=UPI003335EE15
MPMLAARECSPAQAATAFMHGFINCAVEDAMERGDGAQHIMPDLIEKIRPWIEGLKNAEGTAIFTNRPHSRLTVLPGGKKE